MSFIKENDIIYNIVKKYPEIKDTLIEISPKFKKLENPLIFNTVAKFTTVEKAASIGKVYLKEMLYKLNETIGKEEEYFNYEKSRIVNMKDNFLKKSLENNNEKPLWMDKKDNFKILDVRNLGHDPFPEITNEAKKLKTGEGFILIQTFEPLPVISYLAKSGIEHYTEKIKEDEFHVYFYKN